MIPIVDAVRYKPWSLWLTYLKISNGAEREDCGLGTGHEHSCAESHLCPSHPLVPLAMLFDTCRIEVDNQISSLYC